jgi:hypothetical protein
MSEKKNSPARRRLVVAVVAAVVVTAAATILTVSVWRVPQVAKVEEPQPLSPQEIAEVKAAVEKQTGTPIRYVSGIRRGVVDAFPDGIPGRPAYRVKKTDEGWKVIEKFHAYFA